MFDTFKTNKDELSFVTYQLYCFIFNVTKFGANLNSQTCNYKICHKIVNPFNFAYMHGYPLRKSSP